MRIYKPHSESVGKNLLMFCNAYPNLKLYPQSTQITRRIKTMALYLIQHGKSLPKDQDPDQGLSADGIAETERIADLAKDYGVSVSQIRHSVKTRARQTAEIFANALNPGSGIQEISGIKPMDDVAGFAAGIDAVEDIMLVGHLPFMERLTAFLITGSIDRPVFKFQNSGIVRLDKDPATQAWVILWSLMPAIG
jgi:phosphohistidine phosphatase